MALTSLASAFELWARAVLPPGVGAVQLQETRRAFYSGAWTTLEVVCNLAGPDDEDDAVGAERLEKLDRECRQFFENVKKGLA